MNITQDDEMINIQRDHEKMYTVLRGNAPDPIHPKYQEWSGLITAPADYAVTRGLKTGVVFYSVEKGHITYLRDENVSVTTKIQGALTLDPDFKNFHINEDYFFTKDQLIKLVKRYKSFFDDWQPLFSSLRQFNVEIKTNVKDDTSTKERGNASKSFDRNVTSDFPERFLLKLPLVKGLPEVGISVELILVPMDGTIHFQLENWMIENMIKDIKETAITEQLNRFDTAIPRLAV